MNAQELRLGNLVCDYGALCPVDYLMLSRLVEINNSGMKCINLTPIPITEEWLLRFGFQNGGFVCDWWEDNNMFALDIFEDGYKLCIGEELRGIKIKYVHQLQNLYFTLTGEELTIKKIAK